MGSDRLKFPPQRDFGFYQRKKHDKWRAVEAPSPALEYAVADSHAHLHMLPDPQWELARCAANDVDLVCTIADPSEDDMVRVASFANLDDRGIAGSPSFAASDDGMEDGLSAEPGATDNPAFAVPGHHIGLGADDGKLKMPKVLLAVGVHPHNARLYSGELEQQLVQLAGRDAVRVLGEVGLDYHYDFSPRNCQQEVFRRQIRLAKQLGLPLSLHLRSGAEAEEGGEDDAHGQAFRILEEEGFPEAGTLLHCCALGPEALKPWLQAGCYIAYGGALTFKNAEAAREGARLVPEDRLLLETDSPYMTPEPMRGAGCTPAHVVFTAELLARVRGARPGEEREALLRRIHGNTERFLGCSR